MSRTSADLADSAAAAVPFDVDALQRWLRAHAPGFDAPVRVERFAGGQSNPTFRLSAGGARYVLRKKPPGVLLPSAHAVEREYRVIAALQDTGVPVPKSVCVCEDASVIGTPFFVMGFVDGRIYWDPTLPDMSVAERAALYDDLNAVVAALHRVDPAAVGLADFGKPGDYLARQIARWSKQYTASRTAPWEAMDKLVEWLPGRIPGGERVGIVHGDLRLDNMIVDAAQPRIVALLDWELSTIGDPLADFSYHAMTWYLRSDEFRGMAEHDLPALGIPTADAYLARYCERVGRPPVPPDVWEFYLIYNLFRLAAILHGIAKRDEAGTAASASARETGAKARPIAELAWRRAREHLGAR
jgi:aminoglycoside phosphotransferase (APT) family kinase protein